MPCVFVPYSTHNVNDVFAKGGNLNDMLKGKFMNDIRVWQKDYSYEHAAVASIGNQIMPCPIRDHYLEIGRAHV